MRDALIERPASGIDHHAARIDHRRGDAGASHVGSGRWSQEIRRRFLFYLEPLRARYHGDLWGDSLGARTPEEQSAGVVIISRRRRSARIYLRPSASLIRAKWCLLYTSPSPRDRQKSRMPSSA